MLEIIGNGEGPPCEDYPCETCTCHVADFYRRTDKAYVCAHCAAEKAGTPW